MCVCVVFLTFEMIKGKTGVGLCIRLLTLENSIHAFLIMTNSSTDHTAYAKSEKVIILHSEQNCDTFNTDQLILTKENFYLSCKYYHPK